MVDRPIENLTLREMFIDSERLSRELIEHLDRGFLPRTHDLARLVRPVNGEPPDIDKVKDVTVRTHAASLLESEIFTEQVFEKINKYCAAIDSTVARIVSEG